MVKKRCSVKMLCVMASIVAAGLSPTYAEVFYDDFNALNSFWTLSPGGDINFVADPMATHPACLQAGPSTSLSHQFSTIMSGRISFRVYEAENDPLLWSFIALNTKDGSFSEIGKTNDLPEEIDPYYSSKIYDTYSTWDIDPVTNETVYYPVKPPYTFKNLPAAGWHFFEMMYDPGMTRFFIDGQLTNYIAENRGVDEIGFNFQSGTGYKYIDDFSYDLAPLDPSSPVPEPSTLLLLGISAGAFFVRRAMKRPFNK
jgi:hypothetical protein